MWPIDGVVRSGEKVPLHEMRFKTGPAVGGLHVREALAETLCIFVLPMSQAKYQLGTDRFGASSLHILNSRMAARGEYAPHSE